ncbi:IS5 family transposase, partial [Paracoccus fontiphilus]|uniref:IS5 family transposase n=1 Tax=Paracoccus fontiphilus TaxID=1815556 RepID=UPI001A971471
MRGTDETSGSLFSYVDLEDRIPARHPLRKIRQVVNDALASLDDEFDRLYVDFGRPSIAPERLIRASLLQILFSIRSERQLMEQMQYNLLFRWFVGLGIDDAVWVPTVFSKNRDRLLTTEMSRKVMAAILAHREVAPLLSDDHFSVDGTLIKAWASMKSFKPKAEGTSPDDEDPDNPPTQGDTPDDQTAEANPETASMPRSTHRSRNAEVDFKGEKRSNATHASTTDPEARLYKKSLGTGAMLCFMGHALMENRHGLVVQGDLTQADGHAERKAALDMLHRHSPGSTRKLTLGADKAYDAAGFVADLRRACVTPHVAQKARHAAIDGRTTRHKGYALSIKRRKLIEEPFGWAKTV